MFLFDSLYMPDLIRNAYHKCNKSFRNQMEALANGNKTLHRARKLKVMKVMPSHRPQ